MNKLLVNPAKYGCPMPCRHTSYKLEVNYMHKNTWFNPFNLSQVTNFVSLDNFPIKLDHFIIVKCQNLWNGPVLSKVVCWSLKEENFGIALIYETLDVEENIEALVLDAGNLGAEAGGKLGLLLGFSCLTFLFSILQCCKFLGKKKCK